MAFTEQSFYETMEANFCQGWQIDFEYKPK